MRYVLIVFMLLAVACQPEDNVQSFQECVDAGNPVMESHPRQCTANGETFVEEIEEPGPIGGEKDEHGCLVSAGYTWCEAKDKCIRPWEEDCASGMDEESCTEAGGYWNECSSRCMIMAQGEQGRECPAMCEMLCECGGIQGHICPEGYRCIMPEGVADAKGYCSNEANDFCRIYDDVYRCGDFVKVVSEMEGGGSTFYGEGMEIRCPVVSPESMSEACEELMKLECQDACTD